MRCGLCQLLEKHKTYHPQDKQLCIGRECVRMCRMCVMCVPVCSDTLQFLLWHRDLWRHLGSSSSGSGVWAALSVDTLFSFTLVTCYCMGAHSGRWVCSIFKHNFGGFPYFFDYENERICNKLFANGPPDPTTHYCTPHILQLHKVKCKIFQGRCKCVQCRYTHIPLPLVNGGATNKSVWRRMQSSGRKVLVSGAAHKIRDRQTPLCTGNVSLHQIQVYDRGTP